MGETKEDDEGVSLVGLTNAEDHEDGWIFEACGGRRCCPRTAELPRWKGDEERQGRCRSVCRCVETCGAVDSVGEASDAMNRAASGRQCCLLQRASWRQSAQGRDDAV